MMDENSQAARAERRARSHAATPSSPARSNRPKPPSATAWATTSIILSAKVSGVQDLIDVYRDAGGACDYALHLGLTEAGLGSKGIVATTAALSVLLQEGIGDTIRASLTPLPNGDRTEEVIVCQQILQSLGIRSFTPQVTACPGCGRTTSTFFQDMADQIQTYLREQMPVWKDSIRGVEEMKVAVMGCVVNGPGESKHANIGISLPGTFRRAGGAGIRGRQTAAPRCAATASSPSSSGYPQRLRCPDLPGAHTGGHPRALCRLLSSFGADFAFSRNRFSVPDWRGRRPNGKWSGVSARLVDRKLHLETHA